MSCERRHPAANRRDDHAGGRSARRDDARDFRGETRFGAFNAMSKADGCEHDDSFVRLSWRHGAAARKLARGIPLWCSAAPSPTVLGRGFESMFRIECASARA